MLVPYDSKWRNVWMFPRNIRKIPPWKVMQILSLMLEWNRGVYWSGDIAAQTAFTKGLEAMGLKDAGDQRDPNSGGARTYWAQLESLGLIFRRSDGSVWPTIAGEALLGSGSPLEVMQIQLLRYQYPSLYGNSAQVRINSAIRVKPFVFLLRLILDPDLDGLSNAEFAIPVVYGHNDGCFELCKEKILQWRSLGSDGLEVVDNPERDLSTPRTYGNRNAESAWVDIINIVNTFKNALESNSLIYKDAATSRFLATPESAALVDRELTAGVEFIAYRPGYEESFQRAFGRFDRSKDTRRLSPSYAKPASVNAVDAVVLSQFFKHCGQTVPSGDYGTWISEICGKFGLEPEQVQAAINPFLDRSLSIYEATYLDLSRSGASGGLDFAKSTAVIFRSNLAFGVELTGQRKRAGIGGFSDLLLLPIADNACAIVDTKASARYALDSSDYHKMANNYVRNYRELESAAGRRLEFCAYVAGGFVPGVGDRLHSLSEEIRIPAAAVSARTLLDLAKTNPGSEGQEHIRAVFRSGGVLEPSAFLGAKS